MIYSVPTSKAKHYLEENPHVICTDEGEAVGMACGYYLATGQTGTVVMGENGLLNALDSIITLSQLQEIPVNLKLYVREDEPQHAMVSSKLPQLLELYNITAEIL